MTEKQYDSLPKGIKAIVDSWDDNKSLYNECSRIQKELEIYGWTCDYGLDGMVYDVRPINNPNSIDDLNEISANMIADLIQDKLIPDCTDTDDDTEFRVQDIINERLAEFFNLNYEEIQE